MVRESDDQKVRRCFFLKGTYRPLAYAHHTKLLPLARVDRLAVSEVLGDLAALAAKGK